MSGVSIGHSHPRPCSGKNTLRRCRNNDVILIDVDSENFDNVICIDIPESFPKNNQGSSMPRKDKWSFRNVINIEDDETPDSSHFVGEKNVSSSAGTSKNRESFRVTKNFAETADAAVEDSQFVQDNATPVRLSKCKRTYSGKASTFNRYGLDTDSECDSSDSDYPDCELELLIDSSGKVQEMWEKAVSRRRKGIHNGHSGIRDHGGTSHCINRDHHQNAESKDVTRQHKKASSCFTAGKSNNENDTSSSFRTKKDTDFDRTHLSDDTVHDERYNKSDARRRSNSRAQCCPSNHAEQADCPGGDPGSSNSPIKEKTKDPVSSNFASQRASTKKFDCPIPIVEDEGTSKVEPSPPEFESKDAMYRSLFESEINQGRSSKNDHKNVQGMASGSVGERDQFEYRQSRATGAAKDKENLMPERGSFKRSILPEKQHDLSSTRSCNAVIEPKLQKDNSVSNIHQQEDKDGQLDSQNNDQMPPIEACIINDREKLKETDEYKKAIEAEWASRQQALSIQAEEARRLRQLRKRAKTESMRLLDMERRQKQRLEEIRNTQKKDEENMNLKEIIRAEVRKELNKVEIECCSMASLLHLLGIQVGSWPNPSPQEVQTAFRRALLTFHPDRASRSDIRQQVEAEEKFKLINRLKEKFQPS